MSNITPFPTDRVQPAKPGARQAEPSCREKEICVFWRVVANLREAPPGPTLDEAISEVECFALNTDNPAIRWRALALVASFGQRHAAQ